MATTTVTASAGSINVDRATIIKSACAAGSFNPFEAIYAAYNTAISLGVSCEEAPAAAHHILYGIEYDVMAAQAALPAHLPSKVTLCGRRAAADDVRSNHVVCSSQATEPLSNVKGVPENVPSPRRPSSSSSSSIIVKTSHGGFVSRRISKTRMVSPSFSRRRSSISQINTGDINETVARLVSLVMKKQRPATTNKKQSRVSWSSNTLVDVC